MNILPLTLLGFGFLMGIKHALDADHIAALSTILSRNKSIKDSSILGMFWGFGHTVALLVMGFLILLLKITVPEKIALSFELIVGTMLVLLGINLLVQIYKENIHIHKHIHKHMHGKEKHSHFHTHKHTKQHNHFHKSLYIGLLHGLAGSAALSLLVLTTINSIWLGLLYILIFGIGSIIGMMLISSIISIPFALISKRLENAKTMLRASSALISIIIGISVIYSTLIGGLL